MIDAAKLVAAHQAQLSGLISSQDGTGVAQGDGAAGAQSEQGGMATPPQRRMVLTAGKYYVVEAPK